MKELACIGCPMSCVLNVEIAENGEITEVKGNSCKIGDTYARNELTNPVRTLTSTVAITGGRYARLPVITSGQIPKDKMFAVMEEIKKAKVNAPVQVKDVVIQNVCGLGVDVVASRSM